MSSHVYTYTDTILKKGKLALKKRRKSIFFIFLYGKYSQFSHKGVHGFGDRLNHTFRHPLKCHGTSIFEVQLHYLKTAGRGGVRFTKREKYRKKGGKRKRGKILHIYIG